ncbi:hypothetical protein EDC25_1164 [Pseudofulvimonas gallinarii]|uniref:Uncharacterized protein n=1 Tax=Pseudofulvimonas gallinarii TaxID=634155 RepID=A0A4R3LAG2_9GAMM|nr:hypothetical protein EDC25_1164 [Pseudofulvimonas gallinarii]
MKQSLGLVSLVVRDYDEAIDFSSALSVSHSPRTPKCRSNPNAG